MYGFSKISKSIFLPGGFSITPSISVLSYGFPIITDKDAEAFISAAEITDVIQKIAVNQLVLDLKGYSLWTKFNALYPFVGGTATTHKYNLKNPLDTNAAFRLGFSGGLTHSNTGIKPNGVNGYSETYLNYTTLSNGHISIYSREDAVGDQYDMGAYTAGNWQLILSRGGLMQFTGGFNGDSQPRPSVTSHKGFFLNNRVDASITNLWRNGVKLIQTASYPAIAAPTVSVNISKINGLALFSNKEVSFASIGTGLTDNDNANLYTAVQAFQTTLGRQI